MSRDKIVDKGSTEKIFVPKYKKGNKLRALDNTNGLELGGVYEALGDSNMSNSEEQVLIRAKGCEKYVYVRRFEKVSLLDSIVQVNITPWIVDPFPHTVYVKFDNYHKEYSYLCDEETANCYRAWVHSAKSFTEWFAVKVKTPDGSIKEPKVIRLDRNYKHPNATKCIIVESKGYSVEKSIDNPILTNTALQVESKSVEYPVEFKVGDSVTPIECSLYLDMNSIYEVADVNAHGDIKLAGGGSFWRKEKFKISNFKSNSLEVIHHITKEKALQEKETLLKYNPDDVKVIVTDGAGKEVELSWGNTSVRRDFEYVWPTTKALESVKIELGKELNNLIKPKEEVNMSNRKVVSVKLIDQDRALDVADSLVFDFGSIVTEDDQATTIQQLIMDYDVASIVQHHNELRADVVNLEIQSRTGLEVKLRPIKLKDLSWSYSVV